VTNTTVAEDGVAEGARTGDLVAYGAATGGCSVGGADVGAATGDVDDSEIGAHE
jgi:hypothetical protein